MPASPVSLFDPFWVQFSVLLSTHPGVDPTHPLGVIARLLIQQARETFSWPTRPTTRRSP